MTQRLRLAGPASAPLHRRVDLGVRHAIEQGRLRPGDRLPSAADLAKDLKVARLTVLKAFRTLEREGLLSSEVGRGTFVAGGRNGADAPVGAKPDVERALRRLREGYAKGLQEMMRVARPANTIELASGVPSDDTVPDGLLEKLTRDAVAHDARRLYGYGGPAGLLDLRRAVSKWLAADGVAVTPDEVVATSGSQQATSLVAAWARENGRPVLCETPTFTGTPGAFMLFGSAVTSIPWARATGEHEGLDIGALRATTAMRPILYVCPDFHNPTGQTMSEASRRALVAWARERDAVVLEDRIFRDLRFEGEAPPSLFSLLPPGRRILVGSVSKSFMTGLRVGFLASDAPLVAELLPYKRHMDLGGPTLVQAIAASFLADGYGRHVERMRTWYRIRRDAAIEALEKHMPQGTTWTHPQGGFQLWVTLPPGGSAIEVFLRGIEGGVAISPGPAHDVDGRYASSFRLGYGAVSPDDVRRGIARLGAAMKSLGKRESTGVGAPV